MIVGFPLCFLLSFILSMLCFSNSFESFPSKSIAQSDFLKNKPSGKEFRTRVETCLKMSIDPNLVTGYGIIFPITNNTRKLMDWVVDGEPLKEFGNLKIRLYSGVHQQYASLAIVSTCRGADGYEESLDISKKKRPSEAEMKQFKLLLKWIKKEMNIDYKSSYYAYPYNA
jgi:hypothetical protein